MGSGKPERHSKTKEKKGLSLRNPSKKINSKKKTGINKKTDQSKNEENQNKSEASTPASASQQLSFFINEFQSANGVQLSSIELESIKETCFVELSQESGHDVMALGSHMKAAFGPSWKQVLCEGKLVEGIIDPGSPSVLIISTSALRSLELLRGVRSLTKECHAAKLFSKHMKVEEQVAMLKKRVNFASGTPSRIKKLIDIEALGLSRLTMIVLDMHADVKETSSGTCIKISSINDYCKAIYASVCLVLYQAQKHSPKYLGKACSSMEPKAWILTRFDFKSLKVKAKWLDWSLPTSICYCGITSTASRS
ncbi:protein CMSS1 [Populus alba x Populus x berolinensis]|uniref:Protein CMSS1 n=1 Tax=Populus alba x Populus x berolinensis TaxID=444605 RepID=A0AAD6PZ81_9ROSI|nr:protein CMSS1 [Populus alba x Populus x berolinensis]